MPKQLNVSLAFTADTSQARQQLQQLQQQLTTLTTSSLGNKELGLVKDIQNATAAAAQLKVQLESATNVKTGKLDLGKFNDSLKQSGMTLSSYKTQLEKLGPEGSQAFLSLAQSISNAEMPLRRTNSLVKEFGITLMNAARWQFSSSVLHGFMGAIQGAYSYAQNLDKSLTNIAIVTGRSRDEMADFAEQANKSAQALSTTTTAYTDAALIYYQQGLNDADVQARTDATIKLANVTGQSAEQISSYMTAIWNNFEDGSHTMEYYADVITSLGAHTASSSEEIARGMQQFASVANTVGLSYEYAASALATIVAQTRQSETSVGNGLRTIFARLDSLKMGETLEDGVSLTKYTEALEKAGVEVLDQNGKLKDMNTILDEIGERWQTLDKTQKATLANTVGGVRQYSNLMALFDNWDQFQENVSVAENSGGSLETQAETYANSWEAAQKRVKAAWQAIYQDLIDDDFFITMLNGIEKVLQGVDSLIDGIGGLKGVLTTVGFAISVLFENQIAKGLENAAYNIKMMTSAGQQELKDKKTEAWDLASQINIDKGSAEGEAMTTNLQNTAILQKTLYENAQRMSDEEVKINQLLIDGNKALQERNVEAAKAVDLAEEETLKRREALQRSSREEDGYNAADFSKGMALIDGFVLNMSEKKAQMKDIWSTEELDQYNDVYIKNIEKVSEEYHISTDALWEYIAAKEAEAEKNRILAEAQEALASSQTSLTERFKAGGIVLQSMSTDIVRVAQSITGIIQIFRNINSIVETITAPDLSPWEKFVKVLGVVAMTIPMITRTFSAKNIESAKNTVITLANTIATKKNAQANLENAAANTSDAGASMLDTGAKVAEKTATEGATGATMTFSAAIQTLMPWILGISAAIIGIVAVIKIFDAAIYTADERLADANKELRESQIALEQANTAATEATQAYNELSKTLDGWDEKRAGIDELTKGTLEFKQAVASANTELIQTIESAGMLGKVQILYDKNNVAYLSPEDVSAVMQASMEQAMTAATAQTIARIQVEDSKYKTTLANSLKQIQDSAQVSYQTKQISDSQNTADANTTWEKIGGNYFTGKSDEEVISTIEQWAQKLSDAGYTSADLTKEVISNTEELSFLEDIADDSEILGAIGNVVDAIQTKDIASDAYKADLGQQAALNSGVNIDYLPDDMKQDFFTQLGSELLGGEDFATQAQQYEVSEADRMAYADEMGLKWDQIEQQWLDEQGRVVDDVSESYVQQWAYAKNLMSGANEDVINKVAEDYKQKVQQSIFSDVGMNSDSAYAKGWGKGQPGVQEFQDKVNNATDEQLKIYASIEWQGDETPEKALQMLEEAEAKEHHLNVNVNTEDLTQFKGKLEDLQAEHATLSKFIQNNWQDYEDFSEHLAECDAASDALAWSMMRFDDAMQDVSKNYKDWKKALDSKDVVQMNKAVQSLKKTYGNLLDMDGSKLSDDFLKDSENLDLMNTVLNGTEEEAIAAYEALSKAAAVDIAKNKAIELGITFDETAFNTMYETISNEIDALHLKAGDPIPIGSPDYSALVSGLNGMLALVGNDVTAAKNLFAQLGFQAEFENIPAESEDEQTNVPVSANWTPNKSPRFVSVLANTEDEGLMFESREGPQATAYDLDYQEGAPVTTKGKKTTNVGGLKIKDGSLHYIGGGAPKIKNSPARNVGGGGGGKKGGGGCFAAGTLVTLQGYNKNIEDIQVGDIVLSYNEKTKKNVFNKVLQRMVHIVKEKIYSLFIKNEELTVTGIHRFLITRNNKQEWIQASELQKGDLVLFADGTLQEISNISIEEKPLTVYNFEVSNTHNYYVGKNKILAHNKGKKGGGGSGKKAKVEKPKEKKKSAKEEDRYHNIKEKIDDLNKSMERLNKNKDRAYGKQRLKYMDDEIKKTKDQIDLTKKYIAEINKYKKVDEKNLKNVLGKGWKDLNTGKLVGGLNLKDDEIDKLFDKNGVLKDYEGLLEKIQNDFDKKGTNKYNKAIEDYNKAVAKFNKDQNEEAFEKAKEKMAAAEEEYQKQEEVYKQQVDYLKQYEDTINLWQEKQQELTDQMNDLLDKGLEFAKEKVQLQLDLDSDSRDHLEWVYDNLGDSADRAADRIANLGKRSKTVLKDIETNATGMRDAIKKAVENVGLEMNAELDIYDSKKMFETLKEVQRKLKEQANEDGMTSKARLDTQETINTLTEYVSNLREAQTTIREMNDEIIENMSNAIDEWSEKMDENLEKTDKLQDLIDVYKEIGELLGNEAMGLDPEVMKAWDQTMLETKRDAAEIAQQNYIATQGMRRVAEEEYVKAMQEGDELKIKMAKENLDKLMEQEEAYRLEWLQRYRDTLQQAQEIYEKALEENEKTYKKTLGGGLAPNLDKLQEQLETQKKINNLHLDDYEKYKKLGDLQANINKQLAKNPNVKTQGKLRDLLDDVNDRMAAGAEISEGEATILEKRLALLQAEDQLMAARNAKSAVRMTRDNEGNFSYTYTADTSKIEEAQQNYADKFYDLLDYERQYSDETQAAILDSYQEFLSKRNDIINDDTLTKSEKEALLAQLEKDSKAIINFYAKEMEMVTGEMGRLKDKDWKDMEEFLKRPLAEDNDFEDTFKKTTLGQLAPQIKNTTDIVNKFVDAAGALIKGDLGALANFEAANEESTNRMGMTVEEFGKTMSTFQKDVELASNNAVNMAKALDKTLIPSLAQLYETANTDFYDTMSGKFANITTNIENTSNAILGLKSLIAGLSTDDVNLAASLGIDLGYDGDIQEKGKYTTLNEAGITGEVGLAPAASSVAAQYATEGSIKADEKIDKKIADYLAQFSQMTAIDYKSLLNYGNRTNISGGTNTVINANFPNVSSYLEIAMAIDNLSNSASQYTNEDNE